jgi:hypothetical protein
MTGGRYSKLQREPVLEKYIPATTGGMVRVRL